MGALELTLLGGCEGASGPDRPLCLSNKKAWALLAYLALQPGRAFDREHLAGLLWSDRFDEQARKSLRQTLYEIRNALGDAAGEHLDTTRDTVCVNGEDLAVDALRFDALSAGDDEGSLADADTLYKGPLLQGLDTGQETFEEWLAAERGRLHVRACGMLERLAALRLERGDAEAALETARRLIRLDPLNEEAHRLLIRALAAAGRRSEALTHFNELEALLEKELQAAPEPETHALVDAIRAGTLSRGTARQVTASRTSPPAGAPWRWATIAVAIVVVGFGAFAGWLHWTKPDFEPASVANMAYSLPDKPSLAVLPFDNYSDDAKLGFLASGLTEDLTAALSKAPGLFVVSRNSAATYKGKRVDVKQVAEEQGVQYVLEGSIQKAGDKLRITAQLIDALDRRQLWADRFDREAGDVFAMQDEIVKRVFVELQVKLTQGDAARVASRGTDSLEAWLLRVEGSGEFFKFTRKGMTRARELLEAAHRADPDWARPLAGIASIHWYEAKRGWSPSKEDSIRVGMELAERAIQVDPDDPLGYQALGNLFALSGQAERAIKLRRKAAELAPNDFVAVAGLATRLKDFGGEQEAIELFERAMRLSPKHPYWVPTGYGLALHLVGRKEEAVDAYKKAIDLKPKNERPYTFLAAVTADLGRMDEAKAAAEQVMRLNPKFTASRFIQSYSLHDPARDAWYKDLLLRAGLPE